MKTLQNNFTTPEQSKRLLELGVPADSADCFFYLYTNDSDNPHILYKKLSETQADYDSPFSSIKAVLYPCWSVGRLIEIFKKLCPFGDIIGELIMMDENIVESFVHEFENPNVKWNFSKLNE